MKPGVHEDFFDFLAADETVEVCVCFEEDVVIAAPVCDRHHPVYRMLMEEVKTCKVTAG